MDGRTYGWTDGCMDLRTDGKSPHSTGLCHLSGPLPKKQPMAVLFLAVMLDSGYFVGPYRPGMDLKGAKNTCQYLVGTLRKHLNVSDTWRYNDRKSKLMYFAKRCSDLYTLCLNGAPLEWVDSCPYPGVCLVSSMHFKCSATDRIKKFYKCANAIFRIEGRSDNITNSQCSAWLRHIVFRF